MLIHDLKTNVVFWFSQKAGCTYVKGLYLKYCGINKIWPHQLPEEGLPITDLHYTHDIADPIHILFIRDPYKRIVSGFLEKLTLKPEYPDEHIKFLSNYKMGDHLNFEEFIEGLKQHPIFEDPHFSAQANKAYDPNIRFDKVFDVDHIDRPYLDELFHTSTEDPEHKGYFTQYKRYTGKKPAYQLSINEIDQLPCKPEYNQFYNAGIKYRIEELFAKDFLLFGEYGFYYDVTYSVS